MATADSFFYTGTLDIRQEILDDIETSLMTPDRSLPYLRNYGAGLDQYENQPINLELLVKIKYDIASWIAERNQIVSSGQEGLPDRRAITSQTAITVVKSAEGDGIDINIPIICLYDVTKIDNVGVHI